jgi:mannan endo-1,4-beta-mannosidase
MGQDFVNNTNIKEIDFATVHAWPDNWQIPQEKVASFLDKWVQTHIAAASKNLKVSKPVMFEEFGKKLDNKEQTADGIRQLRDPIYASTYDSIEKAITASQPIAGSLFWKWAIPVFNRQDPRGGCAPRFGPGWVGFVCLGFWGQAAAMAQQWHLQ